MKHLVMPWTVDTDSLSKNILFCLFSPHPKKKLFTFGYLLYNIYTCQHLFFYFISIFSGFLNRLRIFQRLAYKENIFLMEAFKSCLENLAVNGRNPKWILVCLDSIFFYLML
jgi:hypothetical protein